VVLADDISSFKLETSFATKTSVMKIMLVNITHYIKEKNSQAAGYTILTKASFTHSLTSLETKQMKKHHNSKLMGLMHFSGFQ